MVTSIIFGVLLLIDVVLVLLLIRQRKVSPDSLRHLEILTEERQLIAQQKNEIYISLNNMREISSKTIERVTILAAEVEQEIKNSQAQLKLAVETTLRESLPALEVPLREIAPKQAALEKAIKQTESARLLLNKAIERAEPVIKFLNKSISYDQLMNTMKEQKHNDARHLIGQGFTPAKVAMELKISESEVRLIAGLSLS